MEWEIIDFGKFRGKGKTLPQILFIDPDWFFYQYEREDGYLKKKYKVDCEKIYFRAKNIKPPMGKYIKYFLYNDGSSWTFSFIDELEAKEKFYKCIGGEVFCQNEEMLDAAYFTILDRIDMSFPHKRKSYDKLSNKIFVQSLKAYLLQTKVVRKEKAETFFMNDKNFF